MTLKVALCTSALVLVSLEWASAAEDPNQDGQPIQEQPGLNAGAGSVSPEIVTDRPDVTESIIVVPKGSLQAKNGLTLTGDDGSRTVDLSETLLRLSHYSLT